MFSETQRAITTTQHSTFQKRIGWGNGADGASKSRIHDVNQLGVTNPLYHFGLHLAHISHPCMRLIADHSPGHPLTIGNLSNGSNIFIIVRSMALQVSDHRMPITLAPHHHLIHLIGIPSIFCVLRWGQIDYDLSSSPISTPKIIMITHFDETACFLLTGLRVIIT